MYQPDIIATARGYIGTRFHHQGRLKRNGKHKGGIDCLGLLVCIARDLDLRGKNGEPLADFDRKDYPHRPDTEALRATLSKHLHELSGDRFQVADVVLLNIDGSPQHMGILASPVTSHQAPDTLLTIIHAYAPARAVVEHALDDYWRSKIMAAFRLPILNN